MADITSALSSSVGNIQSTLNAASNANRQMTEAQMQHDVDSSEQSIARGASSQLKNVANQISQGMAQG